MLSHVNDDVRDALPHHQRRARRPQADLRLRRSREGALVAGVASGIASFLGLERWVVRAAFVVATVASWGIFAVGYPLLWVLLPREPAASVGSTRNGSTPDQ
jgi:phage shock protein PspC (stress-responsive transcriptional regulator)